jgi:hypothetical protein
MYRATGATKRKANQYDAPSSRTTTSATIGTVK